MVDAIIFLSLVVFGDAFLLIPNAPRSAVKILAVSNGGPWGSWYQPQYCPNGSYAVGYNMKDPLNIWSCGHVFSCKAISVMLRAATLPEMHPNWIGKAVGGRIEKEAFDYQDRVVEYPRTEIFDPLSVQDYDVVGSEIQQNQHEHDDTSLNAISLRCQPLNVYRDVGDITSEEGGWGSWENWRMCPNYDHQTFLTSFVLQVEVNQFSGDDTAANYIKFTCRDFNSSFNQEELRSYPGHGSWGSYGDWSQSCPLNSAICGIQTKIEPFQGEGGLFGGDDTALNDVQFICCNDTVH